MLTINAGHASLNLITGCSFGEETLLNEIRKTDVLPEHESSGYFKWINKNRVQKPETVYSSYDEAVEQQLKVNCDLFKTIGYFAGNDCVDMGISGGFDSRLLLGLALSCMKNLSLHSNFKDPPDIDLIIARKLAGTVNHEMIEVPITPPEEMTEEYLMTNLQRAMLFYDGQIRVNHGWTREYRTMEYRRKLLGGCVLGLSGHNGEQYRNYYYLPARGMKMKDFIQDFVLEGDLARIMPSEKLRSAFMQSLAEYIIKKTGPPEKGYMSRKQIRKYYTTEWVRFGPGIRASIENQLSYFFMPFTAEKIINAAGRIDPFMRLYGSFQAGMIRKVNPELAAVRSHYGYNFLHLPLRSRMEILARGMVSNRMTQKIKKGLKIMKTARYPADRIFNCQLLEHTGIPVDWQYLAGINENTYDRTLAFCYLLETCRDKIKFDP
jgi:hypothetical protein